MLYASLIYSLLHSELSTWGTANNWWKVKSVVCTKFTPYYTELSNLAMQTINWWKGRAWCNSLIYLLHFEIFNLVNSQFLQIHWWCMAVPLATTTKRLGGGGTHNAKHFPCCTKNLAHNKLNHTLWYLLTELLTFSKPISHSSKLDSNWREVKGRGGWALIGKGSGEKSWGACYSFGRLYSFQKKIGMTDSLNFLKLGNNPLIIKKYKRHTYIGNNHYITWMHNQYI